MPLRRKRGIYESDKIIYLPVESLLPAHSDNNKPDDGSLEDLAGSIRRYGVLQPLTVKKTNIGHAIVSGNRRLLAAKMAGLTDVPCVVMDLTPTESSTLSLVENLHRRDLTFVEQAEAMARMIEAYSLSQEELARRLGKSQSAVANKLRILRLPKELLTVLVKAGLSERHARALLRLDTDTQRAAALGEMIRQNMNVAAAEEYVDKLTSPNFRNTPKVFVMKDVRLFLNTLSRAVEMLRSGGIDAQCEYEETESDTVIEIKIPKNS